MIISFKESVKKISNFLAWKPKSACAFPILNIIREDLENTYRQSDSHKLTGVTSDIIVLHLLRPWELGADGEYRKRSVIPLSIKFQRDGRVICTKARFLGERIDGTKCAFVTSEPNLEFGRGHHGLALMGNPGRRGLPIDADLDNMFNNLKEENKLYVSIFIKKNEHRWVMNNVEIPQFNNHLLPIQSPDSFKLQDSTIVWCKLGDMERRVQFLNSFGYLGIYLSTMSQGLPSRFSTVSRTSSSYNHFLDVSKHIGLLADSGVESVSRIATILGTSKPVIQALRKVNMEVMQALVHRADILSQLPVSSLPKTLEGWRVIHNIIYLFSIVRLSDNELVNILLREGRKDKWAWGMPRSREVYDIQDAVEWLTVHMSILTPMEERNNYSRVIKVICNGRIDMETLLDFSQNWHSTINEIRQRLALLVATTDSGGRHAIWSSWPSPTKNDVDILHTGQARWLLTSDALDVDGVEMGHCVGSYDRHCACAQAHIAALEAADGTRATVQFSSASRTFTIVQIKTKFNQVPSSACTQLAKEVRKLLIGQSYERMKTLGEDEQLRSSLVGSERTKLFMDVPEHRAALETELCLLLRLSVGELMNRWEKMREENPVRE